jgi:hypothetical protein
MLLKNQLNTGVIYTVLIVLFVCETPHCHMNFNQSSHAPEEQFSPMTYTTTSPFISARF